METILQDLRYGARLLLKSPGFTAVAVLSLALGIGTNATIFSFVNAILLRPLPVSQPDRLVRLYTSTAGGNRFSAFSHRDYLDVREQNQTLAGVAAERLRPLSLSNGGQNEIIPGDIVSGNYFSVLGVEPSRGRFFLPEEDATPNTHPVIVVSSGLWQRRFGADPALVGKSIAINGYSFTVVGIAPASFTGTAFGQSPDVWVPLMMQEKVIPGGSTLGTRDTRWLNVLARLKPGVSVAQARANLEPIASQIAEQNPATNEGMGVTTLPIDEVPEGPRKMMVPVLGVLLVVVLLILLIACANIANLLLARASARRKEIGIRIAMGARRARLVRQLLTESVMLSALGGAVGLLTAIWTPGLLFALVKPPTAFPLAIDFSLDRHVLAFTAALSVLTGVVFGLLPALNASKLDLVPVLKDEGGLPGGGRRRSYLRSALVISQVALSLLLLIGAGLFIRSLQGAESVNPGFDADKLLVASYNVGLTGYDETRGALFHHQVVEHVSALPGVESASLSEVVPLGGTNQQMKIEVDGYEPRPNENLVIDYNVVGQGYFKTLGIPLVKGRAFNERDTASAPGVVVVNEAMAHRLWPNEDAIGKRLRPIGSNKQYLEVVGVVPNGKYRRLKENPLPYFYFALDQSYSPGVTLNVRTAGDPKGQLDAVRRAVLVLDKNLPVYNAKTMTDNIGLSLFDQRIAATLLGFFGFLALVLAGVGLYGVMSYTVSQRTREIGIRMALGARKSSVLKLVIGQGLKLAVIGTVIGIVAAFGAMRLISSMLYGVSASDPVTFGGTALLLLAVTLVASFIPARRATKVEPVEALRSI